MASKHIIVAVKQVFDPSMRADLLKIGVDGRSLEPVAGLSPIMNGYDANAVEAAIALKESLGFRVTVVCLGEETSKNVLRRAIAMGADQGVLIVGEAGLSGDGARTACLLGAAIRKIGSADIILCGRQASDSDAGIVPFYLAEELAMPALSPIKAIHEIADGAAIVERIGDGSSQRLRVSLPAILGVSNEINKPRPASLKGVMMAKKAEIATWSPVDLMAAAPSPALILRRLRLSPPPEGEVEMIDASDAKTAGVALADLLRQEGLI